MAVLDGPSVEVAFVRVITGSRCLGTSYLFTQGQPVVKQKVPKK